METKKAYWLESNETLKLLALVFVAFVILLIIGMGSLPSIFIDEIRYNKFTRLMPFSEAPYPMYLYYVVYSLTSFADDQFFILVKLFNCAFYCAAIPCIYLVARKILTEKWAFFAIILSLLDPGHVFTALTMIEPMYFFFFWLLAMFVICFDSHNTKYFVCSGILLGLLSLVKPHGLFLLPAIMIFMLLDNRDKLKLNKIIIGILTFALIALAVKFTLGFLIAGKSGLTLFGASYISTASNGGALEHLFGGMIRNIPAHFLSITLLFAPALAMYGFCGFMAIKKHCRKLNFIERLSIFTLPSLLILILATSAATSLISGSSFSETAYRIHMRHYLFIFPFFYIALAYMGQQSMPSNYRILRYAFAICAIFATSIAWFTMPFYTIYLHDCPELYGSWNNPVISMLYGLIIISLCAFWMINQSAEWKKTFAGLTICGMLMSSLIAHIDFNEATCSNQYDKAGKVAYYLLSKEDREKTLCLGYNATYMLKTIYHLDLQDAGMRQITHGSVLKPKDIAQKWKYLIVFDNCFDEEDLPALKGDGFKIVQLRQ